MVGIGTVFISVAALADVAAVAASAAGVAAGVDVAEAHINCGND